jgi:hypothetical protein
MKPERNTLIEQTPEQANPYTARAEDFEVRRADDFSSDYVPGHGQHGGNEQEYNKLLKPTASKKRSTATEATDAGKPHSR